MFAHFRYFFSGWYILCDVIKLETKGTGFAFSFFSEVDGFEHKRGMSGFCKLILERCFFSCIKEALSLSFRMNSGECRVFIRDGLFWFRALDAFRLVNLKSIFLLLWAELTPGGFLFYYEF